MKKSLLILTFTLLCGGLFAQKYTTDIKSLEGEYWWGGATALGAQMPFQKSIRTFDLESRNDNNQVVPLLVSNKGRYIWSNTPFEFTASEESIKINSNYEKVDVASAGNTLREAYMEACSKYFKPSGTLPDTLFFTVPQYNTWIELMYNQNQKDILNYAKSINQNNFPGGVIMIDDNWQKHYGNFEFKSDRFPDPKAMVDELHKMGFKVMLWICPFVSADSPEFRELRNKNYLIKNRDGGVAIMEWWNGHSACYDLTNPDAAQHLINSLKKVQSDYGIDGFKFDAGDNNFYSSKNIVSFKKDAISVDHTKAWAEIGLQFPFNEYRACWQMGGEPLVQRLGDKDYSWNALRLLIPEMLSAGLLGYAYTCPDMIGGGQYGSFLNLDQTKFDQDLIVRSAQVHALMPMMQFSVAPWRILDSKHLDIVRNMANLHKQMGSYIMQCARESAKSGEPIVRHMEYSFPNQGFTTCKDQFMLGDKYMVAPVITKEKSREVKLPKGKWRDDLGKIHNGGKIITIDVPIERLPYFEKLK